MELNEALELVLELADANTLDDCIVSKKEQVAAIERVGKFLQHRRECFYAVRGR